MRALRSRELPPRLHHLLPHPELSPASLHRSPGFALLCPASAAGATMQRLTMLWQQERGLWSRFLVISQRAEPQGFPATLPSDRQGLGIGSELPKESSDGGGTRAQLRHVPTYSPQPCTCQVCNAGGIPRGGCIQHPRAEESQMRLLSQLGMDGRGLLLRSITWHTQAQQSLQAPGAKQCLPSWF